MDRMLAERIFAASGRKKPSLVLKHARMVNVFTSELEDGDIAIEGGYIVGIGFYEGETEVDLCCQVVCPGLIDGHIHLESSMLSPEEFAKTVIPHGTSAVITDPHEIANVAGAEGIRFMMERSRNLDLDVYFMLPSCVPAAKLDESGAVLTADDLAPFYQEKYVLGLAELMDSHGTIQADPDILKKIVSAEKHGRIIDGHGPLLCGRQLNAYITAGVGSDHECSCMEEAVEKIKRGQWVMIREGTAARNLKALLPLFEEPYFHRCMLVTDDRHPGELSRLGHMDYIIRMAIRLGADPVRAVIMASYQAARYFRLSETGAIAPGYQANLIVISDLKEFTVSKVYRKGILVAEDGRLVQSKEAGTNAHRQIPDKVGNSFRLKEIVPEDFIMKEEGDTIRVLCLTPGELTTKERLVPWTEKLRADPEALAAMDIVKMAVLERHKNTGHTGLGFLGGYGLKRGAVATSIAHDSHNLIIAGTNDRDMALAGNTVRKNQGGIAVVADGVVLSELALPIGGLMSPESAIWVDERLERLKIHAQQLGIGTGIDPFMTLAFASLPVIPMLRLNTCGLIDVQRQEVVKTIFFSTSKNTYNQ
ncbi:adenine deaminase [Lacrimispora xylanisolvens]|uniref:Adenine deaminase n=1 Tax=Lacrimispora xylanisolvens TaxID=384636 RepID=A0A2S6HPF0_9FIRM|nr:adenine deaminase [Hungatella xylanolytica]MBE5988320.1 adenine deaminase [Paenibacillaceae bacterium]PPK79399.1 adenine deaminase [Hungatella xylanolytica]